MDHKSPRTSIISKKSLGLSVSDLNNKSSTKKVLKKKSSNKRKSSKQTVEESDDGDLNLVVASTLCKEIVDAALEVIYEKELDKQMVRFISQCSRLAWTQLVAMNFQKKDKGGFVEESKAKLDTEPQPSERDNWDGHIPVVSKLDKQTSTFSLVEEAKKTSDEPTDTSFPNVEVESTKSRQEVLKSVLSKLKAVGHFVRMNKRCPRIEEALHPHLRSQRGSRVVELKKDSYELPSPVPLQAKHFPPSRLQLQYTITPGSRAMISRKPPPTKTIRLDKPTPPKQ